MNPWAILGAVAITLLAYLGGRYEGGKLAEAAQLRDEQVAEAVYAKALKATATEIAKLEIKHVTYQSRIERETREVPVYRSVGCNHTDDGLRILNAALTNGAEPAGDRKLPGEPGETRRPELWRNGREAGAGGGDLLQVPNRGHD